MGDRAVRLDPMADDEYARWIEALITGYAAHQAESGAWSEEEALEQSRAQIAGLLPDGPATADAYVYTARDTVTGAAVASVWITLQPRAGRTEAFVYDVEVREEYRGRGYGRATMLAAAERARALGADTVGLNVHGQNTTARNLYRSLGYEETHVRMSLEL